MSGGARTAGGVPRTHPRGRDCRPVEAGGPQGEEEAAAAQETAGRADPPGGHRRRGAGPRHRRTRVRLLPVPVEQGLLVTVPELRRRGQRSPYNVLLIGSDSRVGETAAEAQQFGNQSNAGGQRSDTSRSSVWTRPRAPHRRCPSRGNLRDTVGDVGQQPTLDPDKINSAFGAGPDALIQTIQNTFGIPINHYIVINFFGLEDAVNALGGIPMDFPYPVRDQDCSTGTCYNNSGLNVPTAGCQVLDGSQASLVPVSLLPVLRRRAVELGSHLRHRRIWDVRT